jgi:hypothetical protein
MVAGMILFPLCISITRFVASHFVILLIPAEVRAWGGVGADASDPSKVAQRPIIVCVTGATYGSEVLIAGYTHLIGVRAKLASVVHAILLFVSPPCTVQSITKTVDALQCESVSHAPLIICAQVLAAMSPALTAHPIERRIQIIAAYALISPLEPIPALCVSCARDAPLVVAPGDIACLADRLVSCRIAELGIITAYIALAVNEGGRSVASLAEIRVGRLAEGATRDVARLSCVVNGLS